MERLALAQVGCGGMGLRHVLGMAEARRCGLARFDLVAVCDRHDAAAQHVADQAEMELGRRPRVFNDFTEMLRQETSTQAVNIVTDTRTHHVFALEAMRAGKHVATEKPMGLTVRACRAMIEVAKESGCILSVSENFRREPTIRLAKAAVDAGFVGAPWSIIVVSTAGTKDILQRAAWRHVKLRGGWLLESAVHDADMVMHLMGEVDHVSAEIDIREKYRSTGVGSLTPSSRLGQIDQFYGHRVSEDLDRLESIEVTAEDSALGLLRFSSGATGQLGLSIAAHGQPTNLQIIYGSEGSMTVPTNRTGQLPQFTPAGKDAPISREEFFNLLPHFAFDDVTGRLFGGRGPGGMFDLPFGILDRKLIAIELTDFGNAILASRQPEVTGEAGLAAVALIYALLESGHSGKRVSIEGILTGEIDAYQREIDASIFPLVGSALTATH